MPFWVWASFVAFVLVMLVLDLAVVNRKAHVVRTAEALRWTGVTVLLALGFAVVVFYLYKLGYHGHATDIVDSSIAASDRVKVAWTATTEYLTGWILEYSLSLDNIFVILVIFKYFRVPAEHQHRVLFWGVFGAIVMRGVMIGVASGLLHYVSWTTYLFGAFLLFTAFKLMFSGDEGVHPDKNLIVRQVKRFFPVSAAYDGMKFFTRINGKRALTPLFIVLIVIESTDVVFAVDSIPAIYGITKDPFLVFTSNMFAILGLRSLFFALAAVMENFRYLKTSLVFVLGFIGVKMLIEDFLHISTVYSLTIILMILCLGVVASMFATKRERALRQAPASDISDAALIAYANGRKFVVLVVGVTIIALSIPIGLLPGPGGIAVFLGGLALLATEFLWARSLLKHLKNQTKKLAARADAFVTKNPRPWLIAPVFLAFAALVWTGLHFAPYGPFFSHGPFEQRHVLFAAAGPALAILFWSYLSLKRWTVSRRERALARSPHASPPDQQSIPEVRSITDDAQREANSASR